jgi:phenylacetate-CoA ligase
MLVRSDVQDSGDALLSRKFDKSELRPHPTTGSSGSSICPYYSLKEGHYGSALTFHQQTEAGLGPLDLLAYLRYKVIPEKYTPRFFYRVKMFPLYIGETEALRRVRAAGANVLRSYASILTLLAAANPDVDARFKKVFSTSEYLSPRARQSIEKAFSTQVHNFYGTNEVSWVAWECEYGSMHIHSDSAILEVVDKDGKPAKEGDILITSLWRYSMPFIRYQIGDIGSFGTTCKCGRGTHILKSLKGKDNDFFILKSGRPWSPMFLENVLYTKKEIVLYQALQDEPGQLLINLVASGPMDCPKTIKELQDCLPEDTEIEIALVESLPKGRTGKIKSFISKLKPEGL